MNKPTYDPRSGWHHEVHKPGGPYTSNDPLTRWWRAAKRILNKIKRRKQS